MTDAPKKPPAPPKKKRPLTPAQIKAMRRKADPKALKALARARANGVVV